MSGVEIFHAQSWTVRVVHLHSEPWFVTSDVAKALGYRDAAALIARIDEAEKGYTEIGTPGGPQRMSIINEFGVYRAVFGSSLQRAKEFQTWVVREVLPSIRKTGSYGAPVLPPVPTLGEALEGWLGTVRELEAAQARLAVEAPKVEAFDQLMRSENTSTFEDVAKAVNLGRNTLIKMLREWKVLQPAPSRLPYQTHAHLFDVSYGTHVERGRVVSHVGVRVLPAGVAFIARKVATQSASVELA